MPINKREEAIVYAAMNGNASCFEELYKLYYEKVYALAKTIVKNDEDAEDILQMTFVRAWEKIHTLNDPAAFNTWIQRITVNLCYSMMRRSRPAYSIDDEGYEGEVMQIEDDILLPEQYAEREDLSVRLRAVIDNLSDVQRETILLYYFNEMSVSEIAQVMDCSEGTVKSRLYLARKAIRAEIEEQERLSGQRFYSVVPIPFAAWHAYQVRSAGISAQVAAAVYGKVSGVMYSIPQSQVYGVYHGAQHVASGAPRHAAAGAVKGAAGASGKSSVPLAAKIAAGVAAAALVTGGGVAAWTVLSNTDPVAPEPTAVVGQLDTSAAETAIPTEAPTEAPTIAELDPSEMPQSLTDFLMAFNWGYGKFVDGERIQEYDCSDLGDIYDTFAISIASHPSCADLSLYPGEETQEIWEQSADPLGIFDKLGTTVFEEDKILWVMHNIFNIPEDTCADMLQSSLDKCADTLGTTASSMDNLYEYETGGKKYLYNVMGGVGGLVGTENIRYEQVRYDGDRYYIVYYNPWNTVNRYYYIEMSEKKIDGKTYWTMYRHTKDISKLPAVTSSDAPDTDSAETQSFADISGKYVYTPGSSWGTFITIDSDGSFSGDYHDGHNGTGEYDMEMYYCSFSGSFKNLTKAGQNTYTFELQSLTFDNEAGTEEVKTDPDTGKRVLYKYTEPVGLSMDKTQFTFYSKDTPLSDVPAELSTWIKKFSSGGENGILGYDCLYQPSATFGWHESD